MEMNAMQKLNQVVLEKGPLLAGLDPAPYKIARLMNQGNTMTDTEKYVTVERFCEKYLTCLKGIVGAVKINSAFFEAWGGNQLYQYIAQMAKSMGFMVIGDLKRTDIGNTSEQYAEAYLGDTSPFDFITMGSYLGTDATNPLISMAKESGKGVFALVKTSNKSSSEIQDLKLEDGRRVYEAVGEMVKEWGNSISNGQEDYNIVGAVVGATHPAEARKLRLLMPNTFFLVPGYGAQGATAEDITGNFDKKGGGAIVNSSRGLMFARDNERWKNKFSIHEWDIATAEEAKRAQKELKEAIAKHLAS